MVMESDPRMRSAIRVYVVRLAAIVLTFPLLQTSGCVAIAQQSAINGFFDAVNPLLIASFEEMLAQRFDLAPATSGSDTLP